VAYDYDKLYGEARDALGPPTPFIVKALGRLGPTPARVLDVGCGQGRDALFMARLGHSVVGVDASRNGIRCLVAAAEAEALPVVGIVADIREFVPEGRFDLLLFDRTLHMLAPSEAAAVLARLLGHVVPGGRAMIADEPAGIPGFRAVFAARPESWEEEVARGGYLFMRRSGARRGHTAGGRSRTA
jgi:SAM-dependent methyltransferase